MRAPAVSQGESPVQVHYSARDDRVEIELRGKTQPAEWIEVHPGLRLGLDAEGKWSQIQVLQAAERVGLEQEAKGPEPAAAAEDADHASRVAAATPCEVTVYSDGACSGNPGPGGWAARLKFADGRIVELAGPEAQTTNNRMEMTAAIRALEAVGAAPKITVITDSEYLRKGITQWIHGWKRRGWVTAAKKPVLNQDLWKILDKLNTRSVAWEYTRGHAGDPDNERCDELAQACSRGEQPTLEHDG
jgi:ribonuclease HI